MKTTLYICLALVCAAAIAVFCVCACKKEDHGGKQQMPVELDTTGRIFCSWDPPSNAGEKTVYNVELLLEDGGCAAEFETRETSEWLFDRIAYYLQQNGGTDITFSVKVRAYNDGKFIAEGRSSTVTLTGVIPSGSERTIGGDIALDSILSFSFSGSADYVGGIFGFYVYKAAYGADYEFNWYDNEDGSHFEGETTLTPEDWQELMELINGMSIVSRRFDDPEIHELDGSSETMRISWLDMAQEDSLTELEYGDELRAAIDAWLKQKAADVG